MAFKITTIEKQIVIANRLDDLEDSIEWLYSWYEMSFGIPKEYKSLKFVNDKLNILKNIIPYKPKISKNLYRVIGSNDKLDIGKQLSLKPKQLYSCTILKGKRNWLALADQIGAFDFNFTYVLRINPPIQYIFDTEWVVKTLIKVKELIPENLFNRTEDVVSSYIWQKEIVIFSNTPIKAMVENKLEWDK